jgi:hypothetical protein
MTMLVTTLSARSGFVTKNATLAVSAGSGV